MALGRQAGRVARAARRLLPAVPVLAALAAYADVLGFAFVFDDHAAVLDLPALRAHDVWQAAFGARHSPVANRPLPCLLLVINHALGGFAPAGYHAVNLLLHLGNAWLVSAVAARALGSRNLAGSFAARHARGLALAIATLFAVHPLGVDAVAYVTQRTTLLMANGLLLALWALLRAAASARPRAWEWTAVLGLCVAMASKEEAAAGPLLLLLSDRAFLQPSWPAVRRRWRLHLKSASSWLVLGACVALGPHNPTVGYATVPRASAVDWLATQTGVLLHYLVLAVVPWPLRGAYDWPIARDPAAALLPGLAVLLLLGGAAWLWQRRPWWGFLGAWFFLLLAPTSSVLPVVTEVVAERRMYLPMLAVVVPLVVGAARLLAALAPEPRALARAGACALVAVAGAAIAATRAHATSYRDEAAFWRDAAARNDLTNGSSQAAVILGNYGFVLHEEGHAAAAHALFERAVACAAPPPAVRVHHAVSLAERGDLAGAERELRALVAGEPECGDAAGNLGVLLAQSGDAARRAEAEALLRRAIAQEPARASYCNSLGWLLDGRGDAAEAERWYRQAVRLDPARPEPAVNLVRLLLGARRNAEARAAAAQVRAAAPAAVPVRLQLADQFWQHGERQEVLELLREVLRLDPGNAMAAAALAKVQAAGR